MVRLFWKIKLSYLSENLATPGCGLGTMNITTTIQAIFKWVGGGGGGDWQWFKQESEKCRHDSLWMRTGVKQSSLPLTPGPLAHSYLAVGSDIPPNKSTLSPARAS